MKMIYCLMLLLCPLWNNAQSNMPLGPLSIGDKVPDIQFTEVLNTSYTSTSLAASADKLLLLDFWATWCSACIREFPKLDSIQSRLGDRVNILLINNPKSGDNNDKILAFLSKKKNPGGKKYSMPVVMDSDSINRLFPHLTLPHTVWIYKGKVKAITDAAEVTFKNIQSVLNDLPVNLTQKIEQMDFDPQAQLLQNNNGGNMTATLTRSLFTRYLDGAGGAIGQSGMPGGLKRWFFINQPLLGLYSFCFPGITPNRIKLDGLRDSGFIQQENDLQWKQSHYFCYELIVSQNTTLERVREIMKADLDRQFQLKCNIQYLAINCLALQKKTGDFFIYENSCGQYSGITRDDKDNWKICDQTIATFTETLNWQRAGQPPRPVVIDETGYSGKINLELGIPDLQNIPALQTALKQYGLMLVPCIRQLPMLVISNLNDHQN